MTANVPELARWRSQRFWIDTTTTGSARRPPGRRRCPCRAWSKMRSASAWAAPPPASAGEIAPSMPSVIITSRSPRSSGIVAGRTLRHPVAEHAAEDERDLLAQLRPGAHEPRVDVAHARPRQLRALEVEPGGGHHDAARLQQRLVAGLQQLLRGSPRRARARRSAHSSAASAASGPCPSPSITHDERRRPRSGTNTARSPERVSPSCGAPAMPRSSDAGHASDTARPLDQRDRRALRPGAVWMSNSSTSRRAPGSPSPSPPPVV